MTQNITCIDDYFDAHDTLFDLTVPVFAQAVEGGYIDQQRAIELVAWLDSNPLIAAIYPYTQLHRALSLALSLNGWTSEAENALLRLITCVCTELDAGPNEDELLNLPQRLFGDMYEALFDIPTAPVDLNGWQVEVTGPCTKGSHREMTERAIQAGALPRKGTLRYGYLFVARAHIENRVLSSKILNAIFMRMKYGPAMRVMAEDHFPI